MEAAQKRSERGSQPVESKVQRWRIEFTDATGTTLAILNPEEKTFKTGSRGFYAGGKCDFIGKKFQVSCSIVEIGSKPGSEKPTMN